MAEDQDLCATDAILRQLLLGILPHEQAVRLEEHVLACRCCGERLAGIEAQDTLTEAAHAQATLPDWRNDADVQRLVDRLCQLPMPAVGPPADEPSSAEILKELQRFFAPAKSADELGRIGAYRVLDMLGSGGMGIVLEAEDTQLGRRVALKVMKPLLAASPAAKARFLREARAAAAIEHDNVVTIHQVGEHAGLPFLAMQLLKGESLGERLSRQGKLPVADAIRIGRQIALGLAAAHRQGLVHRDIKPDNIYLETPDDRVKILDFGLARAAGAEDSLTRPGVLAGTPSFMSPEQVCGESVDHRADLFSLGCVLYQLCAGVTPFSGPNTAAVLLATAQRQPPPLDRLAPDAPRALVELIARLLQKDPGERVQSAVEAVAALEEIGARAAEPRAGARPHHPGRRWLIALGIGVMCLAVLAAVVVRLATTGGTLVIELEDPSAAVTLDGRRLSLRLEGEPVQIALSSGAHEMLVTKNGFKAYANAFVMQRGGRVVAKVRLEPLPPVEPTAVSRRSQVPPAPRAGASITPLADSSALIDWLRTNAAAGSASALTRDVGAFVEKQQQEQRGFLFYLGRRLTNSEDMTILAAHDGRCFLCRFRPDEDYPDRAATSIVGVKNAARAATDARLLEVNIDHAEDLDPSRKVEGTLKLQPLCSKEASYAVRLTCCAIVSIAPIDWTPSRTRGKETIAFRQLPQDALKQRGPVLMFVDLCLFPDGDDQSYVIASDPLPVLVNIRRKNAEPPKAPPRPEID